MLQLIESMSNKQRIVKSAIVIQCKMVPVLLSGQSFWYALTKEEFIWKGTTQEFGVVCPLNNWLI
jgi:hypothetical protein